jgi:hypothetical protein
MSSQAKASFYSSGLLSNNLNSSQGITDELLINLQNVPAPQSGKSYYAWLRSDNNQGPAQFLGTLVVEQAKVNFLYTGSQHKNLLANYDSFLITEEPTNITPAVPSPDKRNWRYSAAFPTEHNPADTVNHFSVLMSSKMYHQIRLCLLIQSLLGWPYSSLTQYISSRQGIWITLVPIYRN